MGPRLFDRVVETTTTTGTGALTLAGAVAGYRTFASVGDGNTCPYFIEAIDANGVPTGDWEVGIGTYTASGTTLSRDKVLASSNSGNAVNLAAGTKRVGLTVPAAFLTPVQPCDGRLTTETGVPVSTSDRTAQSTIYFTPYNGNRIALWNGNCWVTYAFTELSLALSGLTSGKNYDVFVYDNAGTLTLELSAAWTNDTTRADALALQDGIYCKSGALTRRHVGTIRTTGTTTTEDSGGGSSSQVGGKRFVWNRYNRVHRDIIVIDTTDNWTYGSTTWRQANNASGNKIEFVCGDVITVDAIAYAITNTDPGPADYVATGVGIDSTSTNSAKFIGGFTTSAATTPIFPVLAIYAGSIAAGYHAINWLEKTGGNTLKFYGDNGTTHFGTGMKVEIFN